MEEVKGLVLVVDDEESVRSIISRKLQLEGYNCVTAADGEEALRTALSQDFDLVLMDIKMPGLSGMEVLPKMVANHPDTGVVMITAVSDIQTAVEAMKLGAYDYLTKPSNLDDLLMRVERAMERRRLVLENKEFHLRLEQRVERQVGQIQQYYNEAIQALAREQMALEKLTGLPGDDAKVDLGGVYLQIGRSLARMAELHEPYLQGHSERVCVPAAEMARHLGCPEELVGNIKLAGIVHDVGKIVVPERILFKPGQLTQEEYNEVKKHPAATVDIVRPLGYFDDIIPLIESHHEWYHGKGYPDKLSGEDIPLGARILAVADAYDAMLSPRPHRARLSMEEAIEILKKGAGSQWDPVVVDALVAGSPKPLKKV